MNATGAADLDQPVLNRNRSGADKLIYSIKLEQLSASDWTRVALMKRAVPLLTGSRSHNRK